MQPAAGRRCSRRATTGDAAYLVATGRLRAFRAGRARVEVELGEIGRERAGRRDVPPRRRAARPRRCTRVRDTPAHPVLAGAAYDELLQPVPAGRARGRAGSPSSARAEPAAVPADAAPGGRSWSSRSRHGVDARAFAAELAAALGARGAPADSADIDAELGRGRHRPDRTTTTSAPSGSRTTSRSWRSSHRHLVYEIDDGGRRGAGGRCAGRTTSCSSPTPQPTPSRARSRRELWALVAGAPPAGEPRAAAPRRTRAADRHRALARSPPARLPPPPPRGATRRHGPARPASWPAPAPRWCSAAAAPAGSPTSACSTCSRSSARRST